MVIISPFKDYYDFVAHQYGDGDPKIRYTRGRISTEEVVVNSFPLTSPERYSPDSVWRNPPQYNQMYLVVVGRLYLIARPYTDMLARLDANSYRLKYWPEKEETERPRKRLYS